MMALSIMALDTEWFITSVINAKWHYAECHFAECRGTTLCGFTIISVNGTQEEGLSLYLEVIFSLLGEGGGEGGVEPMILGLWVECSNAVPGMGEIEILGHVAPLNWAELIKVYFCSCQISYWSCKIFSAQVKNGWDYQSRTTLTKA